jgi:hypothetical protein
MPLPLGRRRRPRPPRRVCSVCGGTVYTYRVPPVHPACLMEPGLADELKRARLERWRERG